MISLAWERSHHATNYRIERRADSTAQWEHLVTLGADAVQFDDRTASALATPSYRLQAINANGESAFTATVTPPNLRPIEQWRFEYFGTTQNTGEAADEYVAGGDGLTNFVKYALGLEPRVPVRSFTTGSLPGRPRTEVNAESASLVYVRPVDRPDIRYGVRASSDLKAWTAVPDVSEGTADGMERRRATVPKAGLVAQSGHRLGTCRSGQRIRAGIPSPNHFAVAAGQPDPPEPLRRPSQGPRRKRLGRRDRTARRSDPSCRYQCRRRNRVRICGHQNNRETHGLRLHLRRNSRALEADSAKVKAVFLFGHIPIVHSGFYNVDGHRTRSMPADAFYGDMDGNWKDSDGDGVLDPSTLPSDVELEVGRVDLAAMPGNLTTNGPASFPSERELLRQYLHKDHEFRHARVPVPRRALIGDRFGRYDGEAFAAGGYRTFAAFFGATNIVKANADDGAPVEERWISLLGRNAYLWAFGSGGGNYTSLRALGTHPPYDSVVTTDLVSVDAKAVFTMVFGSKLVEWDTEDNIMRAVLATPTFGLACSWSGRPHLFYHHMGLGETIGYGIRLSQNNDGLYRNQVNQFPRAVHVALLGDPTLRMHPVAPPRSLTATNGPGGVHLNWTPSADAIEGYHVYRAESAAGPFARLTTSTISGNSFLEALPQSGAVTYMVRAVKLEECPSGSYFNPSQGVFATLTAAPDPPRITAWAEISLGNIQIGWFSRPGLRYRVLSKARLADEKWNDLSGEVEATGPTTTWIDTTAGATSERYYVISTTN